MKEMVIVAPVYLEKEWLTTRQLIEATGIDVVFVERNPAGIGSLSAAINKGFNQAMQMAAYRYVWFVTNITFELTLPAALLQCIKQSGFAAIHPCFTSDHSFCRPGAGEGVAAVPYIEFTAPIVDAIIFDRLPLDEEMPYWGMDLDWGYRVRQQGMQVGVDYRLQIQHTYIRNKSGLDLYTKRRKLARLRTNNITKLKLIHKYGTDWRTTLGYL